MDESEDRGDDNMLDIPKSRRAQELQPSESDAEVAEGGQGDGMLTPPPETQLSDDV